MRRCRAPFSKIRGVTPAKCLGESPLPLILVALTVSMERESKPKNLLKSKDRQQTSSCRATYRSWQRKKPKIQLWWTTLIKPFIIIKGRWMTTQGLPSFIRVTWAREIDSRRRQLLWKLEAPRIASSLKLDQSNLGAMMMTGSLRLGRTLWIYRLKLLMICSHLRLCLLKF